MNMKKKTIVSFLMATAMGLVQTAVAQTMAITNAELHLVDRGNGFETIENGTVLVRDGVIRAVGANVTVPQGMDVVDAGGMPVTPGLFAVLSGLGLEEISLNDEGNDRSPDDKVGFSAVMHATDGFYADATTIPISRAGGVTRAVSALDSGDELISGCATIVDLTGDLEPYTVECAGHIATLGYGGANDVEDSRPAAMAMFRKHLNDAAAFAANPSAYRANWVEGQLSVADAEALQPILSGDRPLVISVHGRSDIVRVLDLAQTYDLDIVLLGATEAYLVADRIAAADVPIILNPMSNLPSNFERFGATLKAAGILEQAGVTVAFYDDDIGYTHNLRLLPQLAGNAVAHGMTHQGALAAITATPAEIWKVDNVLGTISVGKVADLVVWDGDPLELSTRPTHVIIAGEEQSLDNRQKALAERYRDPGRGDMPPAYRGE